jgi:hypothetical protein
MVFASKSTCDLVAGNRKYETVVSKKRSILNMILPNYKGKAKTGKIVDFFLVPLVIGNFLYFFLWASTRYAFLAVV